MSEKKEEKDRETKRVNITRIGNRRERIQKKECREAKEDGERQEERKGKKRLRRNIEKKEQRIKKTKKKEEDRQEEKKLIRKNSDIPVLTHRRFCFHSDKYSSRSCL
jgi:hypothetical protein